MQRPGSGTATVVETAPLLMVLQMRVSVGLLATTIELRYPAAPLQMHPW